jgi:uncharacterized protein YcfL
MKNLYKFSALGVVLGLASTLLIGCGGGSSSNSSASNRADIVFSDAIVVTDASNTNADTRNFNVRGVTNNNDEGIHVGYDDYEFHIEAIDRSNNNFRQFWLSLDREGRPVNLPAGTRLNFATDDVLIYFEDDNANGEWVSISGIAEIVSNEGNKVVIDLEDVTFVPDEGSATGTFKINGRVSYDKRDVDDERNWISSANSHNNVPSSIKSGASKAQKAKKSR